jgi:cation:H+ antiporter
LHRLVFQCGSLPIAPEAVFLLSATAVVLAAIRLSRDGDAIADLTGLGGAWIGAILVAAATSLPELVTDIYAVRNGDINLAMGDLFGSSMANMMILAVADLAVIQHRMLTRIAVSHLLVAATAISLTSVIAAGIVAADPSTVIGMGWAPVVALTGYVAAMRVMHLNREIIPGDHPKAIADSRQRHRSLVRAAIGFSAGAAVIVVAARFLANSSADLAVEYGVSQGFVGVALLAVVTSLPEVTVTIDAVRRASYDLAVGNLIGSCAFNMTIPFALDIANGRESLLLQVDPAVTTSAMFAIFLIALTMIEILHRAERRTWLIEPDALVRIAVYLAGLAMVYRAGG